MAFFCSTFWVTRGVSTFMLLVIVISVDAQQDTTCVCALMDSATMSQLNEPLKKIERKLPSDSTLIEMNKVQHRNIPSQDVQLSKEGMLRGHFLNYNATYISRIEGVYDYGNILQQNLNYTTKVTAFENVPFNMSVFGRYTNSSFFRNYIDFSIDLNANDLSSMAKSRQEFGLSRAYEEKAQMLELYFKDQLKQLSSFSSELRMPENPDCLNRYIHYKEVLSNKDIYLHRVTSGSDSIAIAANYIEKYDKVKQRLDSLKIMTDSLTNEYQNAAGEIRQITGKDKKNITEIGSLLRKYAKSLKLIKVDAPAPEENQKTFWSGFKKFSVGRSMPSSTELSFQNISVNGINTRYKFGKVFSVLQAGVTDFGLRDFVINSSKRRVNSFVYNVGLGIEGKKNEYLLLSVFGGKQNPIYAGNSTGSAKQHTVGVSLSGQVSLKNLTVNGEIAQSEYVKLTPSGTKSTFSISDNTNKAYSVAAYSVFPQLALNINGHYKHYGVNFYGFNAYRINASNSQWGIHGEKSFFHRSLTINMGVKTNDYQNPYVEQVYSGKNTITTINATFRKNRWFITGGYIPSYQYISISDTIYENRYQVINFMTSYSYKIGEIPSSSSIIFNRFLNNNVTSAYFYGNSSNIALAQTFNFNKYSSSFNTSVIKNNLYTYIVFDGGIQYRIGEIVTIKGGFKINSLSAVEYESKAGGYGSTSFAISKVGTLSVLVDFSSYPDINYKLNNNTIGTLGFTTYFN